MLRIICCNKMFTQGRHHYASNGIKDMYYYNNFQEKKFLNDCSFYGNQPTTPSWYHTVSCSSQTQQCSQVLMVNCSGSKAQIVGLVFSLYQPYGFHTKLITDILCIDICCCPFPGKKRRRRVVCCIFSEIYHSKSDLKCIRHQATDVEGLATFVKQKPFSVFGFTITQLQIVTGLFCELLNPFNFKKALLPLI